MQLTFNFTLDTSSMYVIFYSFYLTMYIVIVFGAIIIILLFFFVFQGTY